MLRNAVEPNLELNLGLSDQGTQANNIKVRPGCAAGLTLGCMKQEVEIFSGRLELGLNLGRANRRLVFNYLKFENGPTLDRTRHLPDRMAAV